MEKMKYQWLSILKQAIDLIQTGFGSEYRLTFVKRL